MRVLVLILLVHLKDEVDHQEGGKGWNGRIEIIYLYHIISNHIVVAGYMSSLYSYSCSTSSSFFSLLYPSKSLLLLFLYFNY